MYVNTKLPELREVRTWGNMYAIYVAYIKQMCKCTYLLHTPYLCNSIYSLKKCNIPPYCSPDTSYIVYDVNSNSFNFYVV